MSQSTGAARPLLLRLVFNNGWLKAISFVFAVFLFLLVRSEQVKEVTRVAKVRVLTAPNVIVVGPSEKAVDVTIRFPHSIFFRQPSDAELMGEVDATHEKMGKLRVRLSRENFPSLDRRFTLVIHDPWIEIDLDSRVKRRVPVRAVLQGLPRDGMNIERVIVEPREVEISGAKREVAKIDTLSTSPINIENIDSNFTSLTKLVMDDSSSVRVSHENVNVQVIIGPHKVPRTFHLVQLESPPGLRLDMRPSHIDVQVQGQEDFIKELKPSDIHATVDAVGVSREWRDKKVIVKIPANTTLVSVSPDSVSVRTRK